MPDEPKPAEVATPAAETSAAPASTSATTPKPDDVVTMSKADFEAWNQAQVAPWQKKHSDAEAALGQVKRLAKLPPEAFDTDRNFQSTKAIVISLGVDAEDIKDAETVRDLEMLLRGHQRKAAATPVAKDGEAPAPGSYAAYQEWLKAQGNGAAKPNGTAGYVQTPARTGGGPTKKTIADLADGPWDQKASDELMRSLNAR